MKAYATIGDEPYTGFDDVLIPNPPLPYDAGKGQSLPWEIYRETFNFSVVAKKPTSTPEKRAFELDTNVYLTHTPEDRHTTPKLRAEAWLKKIASNPKASYKLIEQGAVKLPGVPSIATDTKIEPYRFMIESNGSGVIDSLGTRRYHDDERYVQYFYILPISRDEVVTARAVRNKKNDFHNTQFTTQWEHFLKTLKREVANTRSTTVGSTDRTRRYYTHAFSFEIFLPDENTGNQWYNDHGADRTVTWKTPQGEIGFSISIQSHQDLRDMKAYNKKLKDEIKDNVDRMPGFAAEHKLEAPKMTYLEKPLGTATVYGHRQDEEDIDRGVDTSSSDMRFETIYKSGKEIKITLGGSKAAIDANEKLIYKWLADFKFLP